MEGVSLALIGGGRWARVHAAVLCSLHPRIARLIWVSRHNWDAIERAAAGREHPKITVCDSIEEVFAGRPDAAVICTATTNHARDALTVLEGGIPVLVEKPIALASKAAEALVAEAKNRHLSLQLCLPLLHTTYLQQFKAACAGRTIGAMQIQWFDTASETRYGELKQTDLSTHRVDEIVPHVWSLINLLVGHPEPEVIATSVGRSDETTLRLRCGTVEVQVLFGRHAAERRRRVVLDFADGEIAQLDFSREPGVATLGQHRIALDDAWASQPRPLASLYMSFLASLKGPKRQAPAPVHLQECLCTVALADDVRHRVMAQDTARVATLLRDGKTVGTEPELLRLLLDNLGPELALYGIRIDTDSAARRELCEAAVSALLSQAAAPDPPPGCGRMDHSAALVTSGFIEQVRRRLSG